MNLSLLLLCLLLFATCCSTNKRGHPHSGMARAAESHSVTLQPWLVGLTATVGFLFIVFIINIVRIMLRKHRGDDEEWRYENQYEDVDEDHAKQTSL